ncbi:type II toxin-antitoxin system RelE family toxin [Emticicia sp. SJ17W-69]|uniref:type II toxin-antitoxin system RelE family toxin n=1 Tax=Emticicia sp. SJ17W-69 TaxID=3421657 RepID=UPI003EBBB164
MYSIIFTKSAAKELRKLSNQLIARIIPEIQLLAIEPRPTNCKKLKGEENRYRIRIGDYRVL